MPSLRLVVAGSGGSRVGEVAQERTPTVGRRAVAELFGEPANTPNAAYFNE